MKNISKYIQLSIHFVMVFVTFFFVCCVDDPRIEWWHLIIAFPILVVANIFFTSMPEVQKWYNEKVEGINE